MRALNAYVVGAVLLVGMGGCTVIDWVDKKRPPEVPGEEQARLGRLKKQGDSSPRGGPTSQLRANPESLNFGDAVIDVDHQQIIVLSNPSAFAVTVLKVTIDQVAFAWTTESPSLVIPAHGQLALTVRFSPTARQRYSGSLWVEIDSAGGRFTTVHLSGRGIRA